MPGGFFDSRPQQRGGWRCSLCNINYPNDRERFMRCPACHEDCHYMSNVLTTEDWEEQITDNVKSWEGGVPESVPIEWLPTTPEEGEPGSQEGS